MVERKIPVNSHPAPPPPNVKDYPQNVIRNQKYTLWSFLPVTLYEQFKSFINFYYLILTLSQFIPVLKVGPIFTYAAPLAFVVGLSIVMEGYLDVRRMLRDRDVNHEVYKRVTKKGLVDIKAADIKVGHFIQVETDRRIPADMLLIQSSSETGASFVRTDQLDGETDWKLRLAVQSTQKLSRDELFTMAAEVYAEAPKKDIYDFIGTFTTKHPHNVESLNLENTLWSSTVLASDTIIGLVMYTGKETRSVLNTSTPATKVGILDTEINRFTILLCIFQLLLGFSLVVLGLFKGVWWLNYFRFLVLVSAVIPISMSVNLDVAKFIYAWLVITDTDIPGCVVRNTTIPEELGRMSFLLSDKTGTFTQNEMIFKKLNLGVANFSPDSLEDIGTMLEEIYSGSSGPNTPLRDEDVGRKPSKLKQKKRTNIPQKVQEAISALALCHSVTPVHPKEEGDSLEYQASSPDEVALVKFTESVGVILWDRTLTSITLKNPTGNTESYKILECFPFTSERKRMGIIVRNETTNQITFFMKGADVIMEKIVKESDWLREECDNLAREGLRTLVFGQKILTEEEWTEFSASYRKAKESIVDRDENVAAAIEELEEGLDLIGLTGVEDKLQEDIRPSLEALRNAGIKIWMLTGDKRETATCIAISSKLAARNHSFYQMELKNIEDGRRQLQEFSEAYDSILVVDGNSLKILLSQLREEFYASSKHAPAVVCCRCSPTQKAEVVQMIRTYSGLQCAAIGDGGNDVSMIQAANIGVGIVGKEGKQASLAADYSILRFKDITKLLLWHGRNSYLNSALMSQFIIHRGCIMAFIQFIYCAIFYLSPVVIYTGMFVLGYSMWNTAAPVFALCINRDVTESAALMYPELYQELRKGRALSLLTFTIMLLVTVYQAFAIMIGGIFTDLNYIDVTAVTFTALVFVELINISMVVTRWHPLIIISEVATFALYPICMILFFGYYHIQYSSSWEFWLKVCSITAASILPVYAVKFVYYKIHPPAHSKVNEK